MMIKQILGGIPKNPIKFENSNDYQQSNAINLVYEPLPGFDDVSSAAEKQDLFIKKLNMCCVIFDFTDMTKNLTEKDVKRRTLLELVEYVNSANSKFPEIIMKEVMRMISLNLFRALSPSNKGVEDFETDEDEASMEPAWLHLHAVYELLLRFITSPETDVKLAKRYIDQLTVLKLLELFDSEDQREREYLKAILHRMYGKFTVHRPFIRRAVNNIFFQLIFEIENHNGIAEILEILGSIINGFALPLKEEHKLFLIKVLIPLHKPKSLPSYHRQLSHCIAQFVDKDCKLADCVIRGMLKYWPLTNSSKEVMFLVELEQILDLTEIPEFQRCMIPLFQQIGSCISSPHFQVAERALFLWNNDRIENMIRQNISVILPIVLPALERNKNHWNRTVQSLTLSVRKIIYDHDLELIRGCISKLHEAEMREMEITRKRDARWKCLEEIAENKITISFIQLFNDN